jgi:hypothetical protein
MLANLDKVLERIKDERGSVDLSKSKFLAKKIDFVKHKLGEMESRPCIRTSQKLAITRNLVLQKK